MPTRRRATNIRHRSKPDPFAKSVGARVRALRVEKEWSFDAFVEETGLGRGYISELERGLVVPSLTSLAKLAAALDVTVADLVLGDSKRDRLYETTRFLPERDLAVVMRRAEDLAGARTSKK
jgi:XRE family transcriptional regulator, regulator of sulfur utilization